VDKLEPREQMVTQEHPVSPETGETLGPKGLQGLQEIMERMEVQEHQVLLEHPDLRDLLDR